MAAKGTSNAKDSLFDGDVGVEGPDVEGAEERAIEEANAAENGDEVPRVEEKA